MNPYLKYTIIGAAIFGFMVSLRFVPYIKPVQSLLPLSPAAFERLGVSDPPTASSFNNSSNYSSVGSAFPSLTFGRYEFPGSSDSPSTEPEELKGESNQLPAPKPIYKAEIPQISVVTPQEASKTIEKIIERVIVREVPVYVPQQVSTPATVSIQKPAPTATPSASACSIQTFENSVGASSHTLLFRCEGFSQCSIAKNGESFLDVTGKGYFNFSGTPPNNYKIRCDDLARVWSSSITPSATKPIYDQIGFRWFDNDDNEIGGGPLSGINQLVNISKTGLDPIRLRLSVLVGRTQALKGEAKFKLQAAFTTPPTSVNSANINSAVLCNQIPDGEFKDINLLDKLVFVDNPSIADKTLMAPKLDDPFYGTAIPQTYQESNSISNANAAIPQNVPGIWDISFRVRHMLSNELACFRFARSDGSSLDAYDVWPAIYNDK